MIDNESVSDERRRTVLKALGAGAAVSGLSLASTPVAAATVEAELEGRLESVNGDGTITVMSIEVDVQNATISTPTASVVSYDDLTGNALPGRSVPGFVDGTATVIGTTEDTGGTVVATELFVEVAENIILGAVTENTIPEGGTLTGEGSFAVQGVPVEGVDDVRLPTVTVMEGSSHTVDVGTIPEGSLAAVEGYYVDGTLYCHTLEATEGETEGAAATEITRAECDGEELEVRGTSSTTEGTVTAYDHHTDQSLGQTVIEPGDAGGLGEFRLRTDVESCPSVVRVENSNGSQDIANVDE